MIEIKNISKTFHQKKQAFKALHNINLTIEKGDIVGIIGFSGAGKSTLIRTVNYWKDLMKDKLLLTGKILQN